MVWNERYKLLSCDEPPPTFLPKPSIPALLLSLPSRPLSSSALRDEDSSTDLSFGLANSPRSPLSQSLRQLSKERVVLSQGGGGDAAHPRSLLSHLHMRDCQTIGQMDNG